MTAPSVMIDIYNHVMPLAYMEEMKKRSKDQGMIKRMTGLRMLWDLQARAEMLDQFPGVQQVLTLAAPSPEMLGGPEDSPGLARIANDGMADACKKWPEKYPTFVASLPMNNPAAALVEMDRTIGEMGAKGVQILTNVNGRAVDHPDFFPIFERMANHYKLPIWMHPVRPASKADYADEEKSKYEIWQVLGWPFESSVAMSRMVFSGMFDKLPELKLITHHCGGMLPYFGGRAETLWAQLGSRSADGSEADVLKNLKKKPMEYFKMFYGDTVLGGSTAALKCGLDFFGPDHVVFASDCPFDPEGGPMFIREGIRSIKEAGLSSTDFQKVCCGNAFSLMRMAEK